MWTLAKQCAHRQSQPPCRPKSWCSSQAALVRGGEGCVGSWLLLASARAGESRPSACCTSLLPPLAASPAGFIGSSLVELLLQLGYRVRVLDNLSTGAWLVGGASMCSAWQMHPFPPRSALPCHRCRPLLTAPSSACMLARRAGDPAYLDAKQPGLEYLFGDVRRWDDCMRAVQGGVVGVFHLAAASRAPPGMVANESLAHYLQENNAAGTKNMLRAALAVGGVRKVVYAASSTAYGANAVPHSESLLPDPRTPYAASKYMGELVARQFDQEFQLPTLSIRLFSVFGKRQPAEGPYAGPGRLVDALSKVGGWLEGCAVQHHRQCLPQA